MVPLLVLLVMIVFDFSVAVARTAHLIGAVQEGVSYARSAPTDLTNIREHVKKEGPGLNLIDGNISVACFAGLSTTALACSSATFGDSVRVEATYVYSPITPGIVTFLGTPINIVRTATSEIY